MYCVECGTELSAENIIGPYPWILECPNCGHPNDNPDHGVNDEYNGETFDTLRWEHDQWLWFDLHLPDFRCQACYGTGLVLVNSRLYWPETVINDCPFCDAPITTEPVHTLDLRFVGSEDREINPNKTILRL